MSECPSHRSGSVMGAGVVQRQGRTMSAAIGAAIAVALGAGGVVHYVEADIARRISSRATSRSLPADSSTREPTPTLGPRSTPLTDQAIVRPDDAPPPKFLRGEIARTERR